MKDTILSKDTIRITINDDHTYNCNAVTIGRAGENEITQLEITIPEELNTFWAYLDFKISNGATYKTPRLPIENNVIEYDIPSGLIKDGGSLEVQLVLQNENGKIWKSASKKYVVLKSVGAVEDIPFKEDFITEAQKILDSIKNCVVGGSSSTISYVALDSSKWIGTESPYSQVVTISGTTPNSKIDLNPTVEQLNIFHTKDIAFVVENDNGIITVYCIGQKPTNDYTMQVTITEVTING